MSLLFIDGFDHYLLADHMKKWTANTGSFLTIGTTGGRRGGGCLDINHRFGSAKKALNVNCETIIVGFAVKITGNQDYLVMTMGEGDNIQIQVKMNNNLGLEVYRYTTLLGSTPNNTFTYNEYFYFELKVKVSDTVGTVTLRVNGVTALALTGIDTKYSANAYVNYIQLNSPVNSTYYDDLYICDGLGSTNNDFLGDCRVDTLFPNADGTYSDFTCSTGTTHYALVDETTPNTTDYVDGGTVGNRDSFGLTDLATLASQTIYGVQVNVAANKDDAGVKSLAPMVRSSTTNADGTSAALGLTQRFISQIFEQDPSASAAWTEATVNAMQAGAVVT